MKGQLMNNTVLVSDFLDERKLYYQKRVLFEIIKQLKGKETIFLGSEVPVRCIKVHYVDILYNNMNTYKFFRRNYNIYKSLTTYYNLPQFTYEPERRKLQMQEFNIAMRNAIDNDEYNFTISKNFDKEFLVRIEGYDLGMDFDEYCIYLRKDNIGRKYCSIHDEHLAKLNDIGECKSRDFGSCKDFCSNFDLVYEECKKIRDMFKQYHIPFSTIFSGSGFHINIDYINLLVELSKVAQFCDNFTREVADVFNLQTLDTGLYDFRRIWKVPYSYDTKTGNIALPLTDEQFNNFNMNMVKPKNVLMLHIRDRGVPKNIGNKEGLYKFVKDYVD